MNARSEISSHSPILYTQIPGR